MKSPETEPMPRVLVIAIGNPLRSDDGLAWRAADELAKELSTSELEIIRVHQLTPELAEDVRHAKRVIFVDAAASGEPGTVKCERMHPSAGESGSSHHLTPGTLLQLSATLYAAKPTTFLVSVAGQNFEHGELLSPQVELKVPELVAAVRYLLASN